MEHRTLKSWETSVLSNNMSFT